MMLERKEILDFRIPPHPVTSFSPVVFAVSGRQVDLQLKVSTPAKGSKLPIILLSHGHGESNFLSSFRGYGPLVDFYAANGFVVIQPTHQDSKALGLDANGPEGPLFWRSRAEDMHFIIDHLDEIEKQVPGLNGRLDKDKIVAVGHSLGGHTVGMLAGMRITDPEQNKELDFSDNRITAAILIAAPGAGADLAEGASQHYPILKYHRFDKMTTPALVIAGDKDQAAFFAERADWRADAYYGSNGPKCLLTVFGGEHILGGISGYDAKETTDESPERVALIQQYTLAYLKTAVNPEDTSWNQAIHALKKETKPMLKITCKGYSRQMPG